MDNPGRVGSPGWEGNPDREAEGNPGSKAEEGDSPPGVDTVVEGTGYSVADREAGARTKQPVCRLGKRSRVPRLPPHMTLLSMLSRAPPWPRHMTLRLFATAV